MSNPFRSPTNSELARVPRQRGWETTASLAGPSGLRSAPSCRWKHSSLFDTAPGGMRKTERNRLCAAR